MGPRDNLVTGGSVSTAQEMRLAKITEAADVLYTAMHEAEGSTMPSNRFEDHYFASRRMSIAATHLETAVMYARKAALEAP